MTIGSEYEALGPAVFNPSLFKQTLLSKSNIWQVIDRGGLDSLVPIWEVALGLHPDLIQQCEFMRKVWLDKTSNFSSRITKQLRTHLTVNQQPMEI